MLKVSLSRYLRLEGAKVGCIWRRDVPKEGLIKS